MLPWRVPVYIGNLLFMILSTDQKQVLGQIKNEFPLKKASHLFSIMKSVKHGFKKVLFADIVIVKISRNNEKRANQGWLSVEIFSISLIYKILYDPQVV